MSQSANGKATGGRIVPLNLGIKSEIGPVEGTLVPERRMAGHKRMEAIHLLAQGEPHKEIATRLGFTTRQIGRLSAEHKGEIESVKQHIANDTYTALTQLWLADPVKRLAESQSDYEATERQLERLEHIADRAGLPAAQDKAWVACMELRGRIRKSVEDSLGQMLPAMNSDQATGGYLLPVSYLALFRKNLFEMAKAFGVEEKKPEPKAEPAQVPSRSERLSWQDIIRGMVVNLQGHPAQDLIIDAFSTLEPAIAAGTCYDRVFSDADQDCGECPPCTGEEIDVDALFRVLKSSKSDRDGTGEAESAAPEPEPELEPEPKPVQVELFAEIPSRAAS
jgi:hypothetical protein